MKNHIRLFVTLFAFFTIAFTLPTFSQAPPPPQHGQNGNQASPGGTGCPIDTNQGLASVLILSLGLSGFILLQRSRKTQKAE